jgi:hypothetical protein
LTFKLFHIKPLLSKKYSENKDTNPLPMKDFEARTLFNERFRGVIKGYLSLLNHNK